MKLTELYKLLDTKIKREAQRIHKQDEDVVIALTSPSMGPIAMVGITGASSGFDWENGKFIIYPAKPLVVKSAKEAVWDMAHDHIYMLSQQVSHKGNPTSAAKWAKEVLRRSKELDG